MPNRRERRRPLTDRELDELSRIGPEDVERARAAWVRHAPRPFQRLLDARPIGEAPPEGEPGDTDDA